MGAEFMADCTVCLIDRKSWHGPICEACGAAIAAAEEDSVMYWPEQAGIAWR